MVLTRARIIGDVSELCATSKGSVNLASLQVIRLVNVDSPGGLKFSMPYFVGLIARGRTRESSHEQSLSKCHIKHPLMICRPCISHHIAILAKTARGAAI